MSQMLPFGRQSNLKFRYFPFLDQKLEIEIICFENSMLHPSNYYNYKLLFS